jgi:hypothetical protein
MTNMEGVLPLNVWELSVATQQLLGNTAMQFTGELTATESYQEPSAQARVRGLVIAGEPGGARYYRTWPKPRNVLAAFPGAVITQLEVNHFEDDTIQGGIALAAGTIGVQVALYRRDYWDRRGVAQAKRIGIRSDGTYRPLSFDFDKEAQHVSPLDEVMPENSMSLVSRVVLACQRELVIGHSVARAGREFGLGASVTKGFVALYRRWASVPAVSQPKKKPEFVKAWEQAQLR